MKKVIALIMTAVIVVSTSACSGAKSDKDSSKVSEKNLTKMDTIMTLKAYGDSAEKANNEAADRIDEIEKMASSTLEDSDVYRINKAAGKEYVKVHPEILKMLKTALEFSKMSGGAFDITVGPLINLWKIGTPEQRIPSDAEIKASLTLVGYDKISINEAEGSVMLQKEGMAIDLGGIAKGFTADEVLSIYKKYGVKSAIINLGGSSIYGMGIQPDGSAWNVGIQHPRKTRNEGNLGIVKIAEQAVSTSGDYERYFEKDNKRYHHILDPHTGYPADTGVMSDTIIVEGNEPDASMKADLLTTAVFVLGPENGLKFVDKISNIECFITTKDYKLYTSAGYKNDIANLDTDFTLIKE